MSISSIESYGQTSSIYGTSTKTNPANSAISLGANPADTVQISSEAKAMYEKAQAEKVQASSQNLTNDGLDPNKDIEVWQVPSWMADFGALYTPDMSGPSEIGWGLGTVTVQGKEYQHNSDWEEYFESINTHYDDTMEDNGINGIIDHYNQVIYDQERSAELKEDFYSRLEADVELQELMDKLGVFMPA